MIYQRRAKAHPVLREWETDPERDRVVLVDPILCGPVLRISDDKAETCVSSVVVRLGTKRAC
jgi:hypothetical protein